jgi:4-alpha-glucanotransferase
MLAIFPLQDLLATSTHLVPTDPNIERINNPANPSHRWNYRMSIGLERLFSESKFNQKLLRLISTSSRI